MANESAAEEANSLIALLGINPNSLNHNQNPLPSINSWLPLNDLHTITSDFDGSDLESDGDLSEDEESEAQKLQCLLDTEESSSTSFIRRVDERCLSLTSAAVALVADESAIVSESI